MGESNTAKGLSRNNIIVGSNNEIANGVNNAAVFGNYGLAQRLITYQLKMGYPKQIMKM
jgi:hypothetical protein